MFNKLLVLLISNFTLSSFASDCRLISDQVIQWGAKHSITIKSIFNTRLEGYHIQFNSGESELWLLDPSSDDRSAKKLICSVRDNFLVLTSPDSNLVKTIEIPYKQIEPDESDTLSYGELDTFGKLNRRKRSILDVEESPGEQVESRMRSLSILSKTLSAALKGRCQAFA